MAKYGTVQPCQKRISYAFWKIIGFANLHLSYHFKRNDDEYCNKWSIFTLTGTISFHFNFKTYLKLIIPIKNSSILTRHLTIKRFTILDHFPLLTFLYKDHQYCQIKQKLYARYPDDSNFSLAAQNTKHEYQQSRLVNSQYPIFNHRSIALSQTLELVHLDTFLCNYCLSKREKTHLPKFLTTQILIYPLSCVSSFVKLFLYISSYFLHSFNY